jgi:hypothetical protein
MAVAGVERALRRRNRPSWNGYQRDENTEKAADWIKPHHGPCFSPDRAQPPTSLPAQSDNPNRGEQEDSIPCPSLHWRRGTSSMENFYNRNCGEEAIYATRKPGEGRAKEWSRCLAVQVVRKRWRWEARLSEAGDRNNRVVFRRCCGSAVGGPNHCEAWFHQFPAYTGRHDGCRPLQAFPTSRASSE